MSFGIITIFILIFGMCIGSFMNVCIWRLPISKSIISPQSMCPQCGNQIRAYDNIPVLSYILLKGRCRSCGAPIPIRYPLVEIMSGLFAVCVLIRFGLTPAAAVYYAFICVLIVITYIDIDHQIIPNIISLPGIPIFFIASFLIPDIRWLDSVIGILVGGGTLFIVERAYFLTTKKEGMGYGDIKLLAMIGAMIGWKGVLFTVFVSAAIGSLIGISVVLASRKKDLKTPIPYGPFLSIGAITYIFFGERIILWYFYRI